MRPHGGGSCVHRRQQLVAATGRQAGRLLEQASQEGPAGARESPARLEEEEVEAVPVPAPDGPALEYDVEEEEETPVAGRRGRIEQEELAAVQAPAAASRWPPRRGEATERSEGSCSAVRPWRRCGNEAAAAACSGESCSRSRSTSGPASSRCTPKTNVVCTAGRLLIMMWVSSILVEKKCDQPRLCLHLQMDIYMH